MCENNNLTGEIISTASGILAVSGFNFDLDLQDKGEDKEADFGENDREIIIIECDTEDKLQEITATGTQKGMRSTDILCLLHQAIRRIQGKDIPWWHPLKTGNRDSTRKAGGSVFGKVVSETEVDMDDLEDMVVNWFE